MLFRKQKRTEIRELNLRISDDAIQSVNDLNGECDLTLPSVTSFFFFRCEALVV